MNLSFSIHTPTIFFTIVIIYIAMVLGYITSDLNYGDLHRFVKWFPKRNKTKTSNNNYTTNKMQNYYGNSL